MVIDHEAKHLWR